LQFASDSELTEFNIDGKKLVELAKNELNQPKENELLSCIVGRENNYIYHKAAIKIQSRVRA